MGFKTLIPRHTFEEAVTRTHFAVTFMKSILDAVKLLIDSHLFLCIESLRWYITLYYLDVAHSEPVSRTDHHDMTARLVNVSINLAPDTSLPPEEPVVAV